MAILDTVETHLHALKVCPFHQTVLASTLLLSSYLYLRPRAPPPRLYPSPRTQPTTLPTRLVPTPYGTISTTELGPATGKKILLIHGITTPSIVFTGLITSLVSRGYRVLTFDLYGRGNSDAPADLPHDERLFTAQALFALGASELHWDKFTIFGYSLGGGIAVAAAETLKERLEAMILVAPAGILHRNTMGLLLRLGRKGYVPNALATFIARTRRLKRLEVKERLVKAGERDPATDISMAAEWQADHHPGFFPSFISSFRYGPIYERQEEWRRVGEMVVGEKGLKVGVLMGEKDDVIDLRLLPEMVGLLGGEERVRGEVLKGAGHDLVSARPQEVAEFVAKVVESL
ncbi:alpha/beta-hydrolase [Ascodesmis nigricans]|uniref:Alpha/beta-hydrolase n=1 Tax=Ascodesmis nigricans TaxID=341454 RepID=A0A4S2MZ62_9PEZI|nr:alpha/beta-hydrolase [Ascodesmis nigricans]